MRDCVVGYHGGEMVGLVGVLVVERGLPERRG